MHEKAILITGAAGMLGKDIAQLVSREHGMRSFGIVRSEHQTCFANEVVLCDLADAEKLKRILHQIDPAVIIHCAAIVDFDRCEQDHQQADAVHVHATRVLSRFKASTTRFIYVSTDSIFDGEKGNYTESDRAAPLNYYATSKYAGENVALGANPSCAVVRTNIYGFHSEMGKSLAEWAIGNLSSGKSISGFTDVIFNPLYTKQLARLLVRYFVDSRFNGIWHFGTEQFHSKHDFLCSLATTFGYSSALVERGSIEQIHFTAPRPKDTTLNVSRLKDIVGEIPTLDEGLREMQEDYSIAFPKGVL
jgi:dTDP-4-dehydrorhamnose reductase